MMRVTQILAAFCCTGFHGVLVVIWGIHGLSSMGGMIALELMVRRTSHLLIDWPEEITN
jgi:hypothetical protein